MKKYLSIILALIMVLTSLSLVFAEELETAVPEIEVPELGEVLEETPVVPEHTEILIPANACKKDESCIAFKFKDLDLTASYHDTIHIVLNRGLMNGVSEDTFDITSPVTKEMFATVLYRLAGSPEVTEETEYFSVDTVPGAYYMKAVTWLYNNEVMKGISPNTFGIGRQLSICEVKEFLKDFTKVDSGSFELGLYDGELLFTRLQLAEILASYTK